MRLSKDKENKSCNNKENKKGVIDIIKLDQEVEIIIRRYDVLDYYTSKGYNACIGKPFMVDVSDLAENSSAKVLVECDYCHKEYTMPYRIYYRNVLLSDVKKCACKRCGPQKQKDIHRLRYGVDNPMQRKEVREKAARTNLDKYGVDNPMKNKEVQLKMQNTCQEKHGYVSPFQLESVQSKIKQTRLEKYGVEYIFQSEKLKQKAVDTFNAKHGGNTPMCSANIRKKACQTNLERYGSPYPLNVDSILSKSSITRYKNETCKVSKEQYRLSKLFKGLLNYPIGRYNADILLNHNIVLEYDGGAHDMSVKYNHYTYEEFLEHESKRSQYILKRGYQIIHFSNKDDVYISDEMYIDALNICLDRLKFCDEAFYEF